MARLQQFILTHLVAAIAAAWLAIPAQAAVVYQYGDASWSIAMEGRSGTGSYLLAPGTNGDSVYSYAITCYAEGCEGLKWGGSVLSASWNANLTNNALNYNFTAMEGTDSGSIITDLDLFLLFHTDREPLLFSSEKTSTTPAGPDCIGCQGPFSWNAGSEVDPAGGYIVWVLLTSDATLAYGENLVGHQLQLTVGEAPEPATWTMLLAGLFAAGAALRSRRKAAATT